MPSVAYARPEPDDPRISVGVMGDGSPVFVRHISDAEIAAALAGYVPCELTGADLEVVEAVLRAGEFGEPCQLPAVQDEQEPGNS